MKSFKQFLTEMESPAQDNQDNQDIPDYHKYYNPDGTPNYEETPRSPVPPGGIDPTPEQQQQMEEWYKQMPDKKNFDKDGDGKLSDEERRAYDEAMREWYDKFPWTDNEDYEYWKKVIKQGQKWSQEDFDFYDWLWRQFRGKGGPLEWHGRPRKVDPRWDFPSAPWNQPRN